MNDLDRNLATCCLQGCKWRFSDTFVSAFIMLNLFDAGCVGWEWIRVMFCILRMSHSVSAVLENNFFFFFSIHCGDIVFNFLAWLYFSPQGQKTYISRQMNYIDPQMHRATLGLQELETPVICNVMNGHKGGEKCINIIRYSLLLFQGFQTGSEVEGEWLNRKATVEQPSPTGS